MKSILDGVSAALRTGEIEAQQGELTETAFLVFEGQTVMGFVVHYPSVTALLDSWRGDLDALVSRFRFGIRRADRKAWNTYGVLLADGHADPSEQSRLGLIEEDLTGTRKIARAIGDGSDLERAILPLLPLQHAPRLEAIDIRAEIRLRTKELPADLVDVFLSDAPDSVVLQVMEDSNEA